MREGNPTLNTLGSLVNPSARIQFARTAKSQARPTATQTRRRRSGNQLIGRILRQLQTTLAIPNLQDTQATGGADTATGSKRHQGGLLRRALPQALILTL